MGKRKQHEASFDIFLDIVSPSPIDLMCRYFMAFVRCGSLGKAKQVHDSKEFKTNQRYKKSFEIAFEAVYGYRDGYCEEICNKFEYRKSKFGEDRFSEPDRLTCFECDQLFLKQILTEITEGKEYLDIGPDMALETLISQAHRNLRKVVGASPNGDADSGFSQRLSELRFFMPDRVLSPQANYKDSFRRIFLEQFVAYSLTEFLLKHDRRKLRRCEECNEFYISNTLKKEQRFCQRKCRQDWNNRERIKSGKAREYKARKRKEGARESYYG